MGDDQASKGDIKMLNNKEQHRENLLKLIKMMKGVYNESIIDNKSREISDDNSKKYISYERLLSIRELTRMFIEELNSSNLKCLDGDEIVGFIEDTVKWLQSSYDFTIENNVGSTGVKSLKVCSQSLNDYKKVYNEAKESKVIKGSGNVVAIIDNVRGLEFGKRNLSKEQYTSNIVQPITINLTFTGDSKENEITAEKLKNMIDKYSKDSGRRFI